MKHILTKEAERRGLVTIYGGMVLVGFFVALFCNRPMHKTADYADVHKVDTLHSGIPVTRTLRVDTTDAVSTKYYPNRIRYAKDY